MQPSSHQNARRSRPEDAATHVTVRRRIDSIMGEFEFIVP